MKIEKFMLLPSPTPGKNVERWKREDKKERKEVK